MRKETISQFRKTHNLTQRELAQMIGMPVATLSSYERGYGHMPVWFLTKMSDLVDEYGVNYDLEFTRTPVIKHPTGPRGPNKPKQEELDMPEVVLPPDSNHYNGGNVDHIDVIKFAEANFSQEQLIGFYRINAIKYIARYGKKDGFNPKDLEKAEFYLNKLKEETQ